MNPMELFSSLESRYKLPQGYLGRVYQVESSGGKNLYNEKSGARGPFQFIPSTARGMGLENPDDLGQSAEAAARLAAQNRAYLQSKGIENVDGRVLYLAHNQGADGAYRLLTNADKPADKLVGEKAVTWNSGKEGQPAGEFATTIMSKYGEGEGGKASKPYSALGETAPIAEAADEERRASRRETYALNTLLNATKELEPKQAPMLPIPRLSYFKGGIVSLAALPEDESESNLRPTPILFGGEKAENIDRAKLEEARRNLAEGRDPNEVYQQTRMPDTTGWYMGPDKKLRFEFSDKDAAVDKKAFDSLKGGSSLSLGDVLKHDDLFKYYPSAKDITVQMLTKEEEEDGLKGSYKQNLLRLSSDPEEAKKTILHEAQHFIQDREKFAPGGTTEVADYAPVNMLFEKIRLGNQEYKLMDKDRENADKKYRELINKGVSADEALKEYEKKPLSEKFNRETVLPFEEKIRQYERDMRKAGPFESYRRLSGETESRNVEKRIPMSLEERAASIPTGTEEYPSNRQFVIPRVEEDLGFAKGGIVSLVDTAEDVRAAGRGRDTVLAHITPQEAAFLKARGGAGTINPKTGLLEFDDDWGGGWSYTPSYEPTYYGSVSYDTSYTPSYEPVYTPSYEPPTTSYTYDFGFGTNQDYYGSPTWSFTPNSSGGSQPGDYGSYNYGYNDVDTSATYIPYVAPTIDQTPYTPPTYDPYQYYDAGYQVMPETAPEVLSYPSETLVTPPPQEAVVTPPPQEAVVTPPPQEAVVTPPPQEAVVTTPMGDNTGFVETPVVETPRVPVTPVSFDLSKFMSPASTGVSGADISAIPQEPSVSPYIDVITGLEDANKAAYGTLGKVNFDLEKFLGPSEGGKFGLSGPEGSYVPQPVDTKSLAGVFGPQEATFSRYIDVRPDLQTDVYNKAVAANPFGKLEMEKILASFGGVRPPTYTSVSPNSARTATAYSSIPAPSSPVPVTSLFPSTAASYVAPEPIRTGYEVLPTGPFYPDLLTGNISIPTPATSTPRPDYNVLYDLANFLSKQGSNGSTNVTPYVEVKPGAGTSSKQAPLPSFSSISYPTGSPPDTKTS